MTAADDLADVRALVADVATDAAQIVATDFARLIADVAREKYRDGYEDGRAERDPYADEARARKARSQFRLITQPAGR